MREGRQSLETAGRATVYVKAKAEVAKLVSRNIDARTRALEAELESLP